MTSIFPRRQVLLAASLLLFSPLGLAQTLDFLTVTPSTQEPGAVAEYRIEFRSGSDNSVIPAGDVVYRVRFPAEPVFTVDGSVSNVYGTREGPGAGPYPAYTLLNDIGGSYATPQNLWSINLAATQSNTPGSTWYDLYRIGMVNPATPGVYPVEVYLYNNATNTIVGEGVANVTIASPVAQGVEIDAGPSTPETYASEIIATPASPVTLANPSGDLNLSSSLGYSFSVGEVRHARIQCYGDLSFDAGASAIYDGGGSASLGSINGLGTSVITFSVTANDNNVVAADRVVIDGARRIEGTSNVNCEYSLYDFPSQALAGGAAGRVARFSGLYIRFADSYVLDVDNMGNPVADVESPEPPYSAFTPGSATNDIDLGQVGGFSYGTTNDVLGRFQPQRPDGAEMGLADLMAADTALLFSGDFSAADDVFLSSAPDCGVNVQVADDFDAAGAVFTVGAGAAVDRFLCLETSGNPIPAGDYTVSLDAVPAAPTVYQVKDLGPLDLGAITRNGTELQAPLAQVPGNWLSRIVLTNSGPVDYDFRIRVFGETGNTISTSGPMSGVIDARSTRVIDLKDVLTGFTGDPRATIKLTVAAPNRQIQGLYQIVNPDSGSISNHVMVRPGTN